MTDLAEEIARYGCVAVTGLAKNAGKTVTLNYLLRKARERGLRLGVTSIGLDGESLDQVTGTGKPEIRLSRDTLFATCEALYRTRGITAEVREIASRHTSMGRVIVANALADGKVMLAGPPDTASMKETVRLMRRNGAETVLVDGALSRMSTGSPDVSDAMILATGAALSPDIRKIVRKTAFVCRLAGLPETGPELAGRLDSLTTGVWAIDGEGIPHDLGVKSALELRSVRERAFRYGTSIYASGVVTDNLLKFFASQKEASEIELTVRDFTRLFVEPATLRLYLAKGGKLKVLKKTPLLAVTVNPWSPAGFTLDSDRLVGALREEITVPVMNVGERV